MSSTSVNSTWERIPDLTGACLVSVTPKGERQVSLSCRLTDDSRIFFTISKSSYEQLGAPAKGSLLSHPLGIRLTKVANHTLAIRCALYILGYGDNSARKLTYKLKSKGFTPEEADYATSQMVLHGYLREGDFAKRQVELCSKKGWSQKKTVAFLYEKGYDTATIQRAIQASIEDGTADFEENRRRFIEDKKKHGITGPALRNALYRAGF